MPMILLEAGQVMRILSGETKGVSRWRLPMRFLTNFDGDCKRIIDALPVLFSQHPYAPATVLPSTHDWFIHELTMRDRQVYLTKAHD